MQNIDPWSEVTDEADTSKDVSDIESDWDEELCSETDSLQHLHHATPSSVTNNNNKRSIFIHHKKIKKFSL